MKWITQCKTQSGDRQETVEVGILGDPPLKVTVGRQELEIDLVGGSNNGRLTSVYSAIVDGQQTEIGATRVALDRYAISINGRNLEVLVNDQLTILARRGEAKKGGRGNGLVSAYMPGKVVAVLVSEGEAVVVGQGVVVLEAMKMENEIQAEIDGVLAKIHVKPGQPVEGNDPLFEIHPPNE